ncbi:hypothetical protein NUQ41_02620 [Glaesserella parasuis]|nr:hypothetical protein [Glaesserella parasuis]
MSQRLFEAFPWFVAVQGKRLNLVIELGIMKGSSLFLECPIGNAVSQY